MPNGSPYQCNACGDWVAPGDAHGCIGWRPAGQADFGPTHGYRTWSHGPGAGEAWVQARDYGRLMEEAAQLRAAIENYLLWEPGRRGHAAAHRALASTVGRGHLKVCAGDCQRLIPRTGPALCDACDWACRRRTHIEAAND